MTYKRGQAPSGYYTATIAKRKLGNITDGRLRYYVQQGKIERFVPPGMGQGFYSQKDVENLARIIDEFHDSPEHAKPRFRIATAEDMPEIVSFMIEQFGGNNTLERRLSWLRQNPEIAFIERNSAKNGEGKIVGCVFALPLTLEKINELFAKSEPSTRIITEKDIQQFIPGQPTYLFVMGMAVEAKTGLVVKRARGQTIIRGVIEFFVNLGRKGIDIKLIAARSETRDGIGLLKHAGFTEIETSTENRNFIIEVERSGIPLIMRYKQALAEWKSQHS